MRAYHGTRNLESEGAELRAAQSAESLLEQFIRHVCAWGGYAGIAGRVLKHNSLSSIHNYFVDANDQLDQITPNVQRALQSINAIRQLGSPPFASKQLRFLRPDVCPVLDNYNSSALDYRFSPEGYRQLSEDCLRVAVLLGQSSVANPMNRPNRAWYAADVEMALFAFIRNLDAET